MTLVTGEDIKHLEINSRVNEYDPSLFFLIGGLLTLFVNRGKI